MPKIKEKVKRNLLDDNPQNLVKQEEDKDDVDKTYYPYFKPEIYVYLVLDTTSYTSNSFPPPVANAVKLDFDTMTYDPIIYLSDYWVLKKNLILVNETVPELNLTLHFYTYSLTYFIFQKQFEEQHKV